jgi:hypothetical protein
MSNIVTLKFMANITYGGAKFNTLLICEYKHSGATYKCIKKGYTEKFTTDIEIANEWRAKGKKVIEGHGYYYVDRIAIPTTNAKGEKDIWYINNEDDEYKVNKVSKYGRKIHQELTSIDRKPIK